MPRKERPLPRPPVKKRTHGFHEKAETEGLVFDKLQQAVAEGRIEEFMKENMPEGPEGEYARKLTQMMMGMSGIPFTADIPARGPEAPEMEDNETKRPMAPERPMTKVPQDVLQAAMAGDVSSLKDLLKREQHKASPHPGKKKGEDVPREEEIKGPEEENGSLVERDIIESLYEISVDNDLSMDWLIYRALKLYIKKYRETGQL